MTAADKNSWKIMSRLFKAHPWHGISIGESAPEIVNCYIEIVPADLIKYEIDKTTGHLEVNRPQKYSNYCPTLYGIIPQTFCGARVGRLCSDKTAQSGIAGDGDPMDICVITEKPFQHGGILLHAVPIGGLRVIDRKQADDKIVAVLYEDGVYGKWRDISECPKNLLERLRHYFLTYKDIPGGEKTKMQLGDVYGAGEARAVIEASRADYLEQYGDIAELAGLCRTA